MKGPITIQNLKKTEIWNKETASFKVYVWVYKKLENETYGSVRFVLVFFRKLRINLTKHDMWNNKKLCIVTA